MKKTTQTAETNRSYFYRQFTPNYHYPQNHSPLFPSKSNLNHLSLINLHIKPPTQDALYSYSPHHDLLTGIGHKDSH